MVKSVITDESYRKLKLRAAKFGRQDLVGKIDDAMKEPAFNIAEFVEFCKELKVNPYLLFRQVGEPQIHFTPRTEEEQELYAVAESILYYVEDNCLSKLVPYSFSSTNGMLEFYRELVFANGKKPGLDLVEFCKSLKIGIILLSDEAPVDGFYAESSDKRRDASSGKTYEKTYLFSKPEKQVFAGVLSQCLKAREDEELSYVPNFWDNFELEFDKGKCFSASYNHEIFDNPKKYLCLLGKAGAFFEKARKYLFYPHPHAEGRDGYLRLGREECRL